MCRPNLSTIYDCSELLLAVQSLFRPDWTFQRTSISCFYSYQKRVPTGHSIKVRYTIGMI